MIFADAGYFIALCIPRDALHSRARGWSDIVTERVVTTEYVLWECVNFLARGRLRPKADTLVEYLTTDPDCDLVRASAPLFDEGMSLFRRRPDKNWSLTDCISFHIMLRNNITKALAQDRHFEEAGFQALLRVDPPSVGG
ncbi:MAG: type II toxin-antitoxin system VapC family toxin [Planctomycetes bacterium]|nr:type II toxin-antitoxin system VapC family toxin [Planctomycetota bacterium]